MSEPNPITIGPALPDTGNPAQLVAGVPVVSTTPATVPTSSSIPAALPDSVLTAEGILGQLKKLPALELDTLVETLEQLGARSSPEEVEETEEDDEDVSVEPPSVSPRAVPPRQVRVEDMDPSARKALATVHNQLMVRSIKEAIDSDQELGYNLKALTVAGRASFDRLVKREISGILDQAGADFDYDWETTAKSAVRAAKNFLGPLMERRPSMLGAPGSPGSGDSRTLEEPVRVSELSNRDERDKYLSDRLRFNVDRLTREQTTNVD